MTARTFPSYRLFRDHRGNWRWRYDLHEHQPLAVSADAYASRAECERMLSLLRAPSDVPHWVAKPDLTDA